MQEEGVNVILNQRPQVDVENKKIVFADGRELNAGYVLMAARGSPPATEFFPDHTVDEHGYVKVQPSLVMGETGNSTYAIGDIALVSGIKRAGAALRMGAMAAVNIFSTILAENGDIPEAKMLEWPEVPPMMALAVGKQAVTCGPTGITYGREAMQLNFGDDLGWTNTMKFLGIEQKS